MIAPHKFDSYQISIKKVDAPVATRAVPTYTTKQGKSTNAVRNQYQVIFTTTCGNPITFYVNCSSCSEFELINLVEPQVLSINYAYCNQIPTFMIYQIIES